MSYSDRCFSLVGEMEQGAKSIWHMVGVAVVLTCDRREGLGLRSCREDMDFDLHPQDDEGHLKWKR